MKRQICLLLTLILALATPVLAMNHDAAHDSKGMDQDSMKSMNHDTMDHDMSGHGGMSMEGHMMMLGNMEVEGVTAMAHLNDVHEAMAKAGMAKTHHLMIAFEGAKGKIEQGAVAVKVTDPSGKTSSPTMLMGMQGHFGVDLELREKGTYTFDVGTKLADGKKRQYTFTYVQD
jgi:hypothetical protein